jgi:hypothetical protein
MTFAFASDGSCCVAGKFNYAMRIFGAAREAEKGGKTMLQAGNSNSILPPYFHEFR